MHMAVTAGHLNGAACEKVMRLFEERKPIDYGLWEDVRQERFNALVEYESAVRRRGTGALFGKTAGVSGGRGGSMHLFDRKLRLLGGYGIVGGQIPPATGAALALTYRQGPGPEAEAVMCVLGDGTTNIGAFHESLNLAYDSERLITPRDLTRSLHPRRVDTLSR
ncbi:MAG TPA: thiamine pyrophosphate-dependent enzyme [Mycobacterium sp.]|nr:thiamine pyrophosphate-dependent enzyme [Mycobacterium sp.]